MIYASKVRITITEFTLLKTSFVKQSPKKRVLPARVYNLLSVTYKQIKKFFQANFRNSRSSKSGVDAKNSLRYL